MPQTSFAETIVTRSPDALEKAVIIGAGPAGLAVAACLIRSGIHPVVLEQAESVGASWRNHYDRLHLHTSKKVSALPHLPLPRSLPRYPSRDQFVEYLELYSRTFGIEPEFGERVTDAGRVGGAWRVTCESGKQLQAENLVIATGTNHIPHIPIWAGRNSFRGMVIHSSEYRNGAPWRGQRVLVVGFGNSGSEIALDLFEHGAKPTLSVRGVANTVPRDLFGIPISILGRYSGRLPPVITETLFNPLLRFRVGDLKRIGLTPPPDGALTHIRKTRRVPMIDVGTTARIRTGGIAVRPGIERFTETGVVFSDGRQEEFDAVVLATGYRPGWDRFLRVERPVELDWGDAIALME